MAETAAVRSEHVLSLLCSTAVRGTAVRGTAVQLNSRPCRWEQLLLEAHLCKQMCFSNPRNSDYDFFPVLREFSSRYTIFKLTLEIVAHDILNY